MKPSPRPANLIEFARPATTAGRFAHLEVGWGTKFSRFPPARPIPKLYTFVEPIRVKISMELGSFALSIVFANFMALDSSCLSSKSYTVRLRGHVGSTEDPPMHYGR